MLGKDEGGGRNSGRGDPASTTIRKSSLGYAAMRAESKREREREALSLAGTFAPLYLNAPAKRLLARTFVEGRREEEEGKAGEGSPKSRS